MSNYQLIVNATKFGAIVGTTLGIFATLNNSNVIFTLDIGEEKTTIVPGKLTRPLLSGLIGCVLGFSGSILVVSNMEMLIGITQICNFVGI